MNLYEISKEFEDTLSDLIDMEVEEEVLKDTLSGVVAEFEDKGKAVAAYALNLKAQVDTYKEHEAKIAKKRKSAENRLNWLKEYLRSNMVRTGISKIEAPLFSVKLTTPKESVVVDETKLDADYMRVKSEPDKTLIKKAIKDGYEVKGASLVKGEPGISIS